MRCPVCGSRKTVVNGTKLVKEGRRRYRECSSCGERFKTIEVVGSCDAESVEKTAFKYFLNKLVAEERRNGKS